MHLNINIKLRKGMTLIELIVTMFMAILLIAVGLPGFLTLRQSQAQTAAVNQTYGVLQFARSLAITDATRVTLCTSSNQLTCTGESNFAVGSIVTATATDGSETLVRVIDPVDIVDFEVELFGFPSISQVQFNDTGEIIALNTNASITFCDPRGDQLAAALIVNPLGMIRAATDDDDNQVVNLHNQADISC